MNFLPPYCISNRVPGYPCTVRRTRRYILRRAYLSRLETTQRCERAGVAVKLMYTSSTPTHMNNGEQTRDTWKAREGPDTLRAFVRQPCSNAARVMAQPVWEGGGEAVWPTEQFMRSLPFFSAIIGRRALSMFPCGTQVLDNLSPHPIIVFAADPPEAEQVCGMVGC